MSAIKSAEHYTIGNRKLAYGLSRAVMVKSGLYLMLVADLPTMERLEYSQKSLASKKYNRSCWQQRPNLPANYEPNPCANLCAATVCLMPYSINS